MRPRTRSPFRIVRLAHAHPRLWIAIAAGLACYFALLAFSPEWDTVTRMLVGWNIGVTIYLAATARMMADSSVAEIRRHAAAHDEGAFALLALTVASALASLAAIFMEIGSIDTKSSAYGLYAAHAIITVLLSWAFIHTIFALHYAYEFYGEGRRANGLKFPDDAHPDYWDFIYFSFVIGMTFQVSDVAVANKWIRRTVVCHGALSFFFTTAVIALTVNLAAGNFSR